MDLPTDILYEIFGHVDDKATIDHALAVVPDIVHRAVRRIRSPRVVQVSIDYLVAFKRLEHTTNVLVRVKQEDLDTLRPLSHLRSLCVQVSGEHECLSRLEQIFRVEDKRDDQFFVFKIQARYAAWVCYHNSHRVGRQYTSTVSGFTEVSYYSPYPRCYYDLLQAVRPYVDDTLGDVLDIVLKHRHHVRIEHHLVRSIARRLGKRLGGLVDRYMRDFIRDARASKNTRPDDKIVQSIIAGRNLPWRLLHYYDIPDRPSSLTKEEEEIIERLG